MTLFGRCRHPMYPHVSTTGFEKGLFCQQMACCSTQRCEGPDPRLWLLADGLATSSPISSAFRINIAPLAGIQSCWDPLLSRTVRPIPENVQISYSPTVHRESSGLIQPWKVLRTVQWDQGYIVLSSRFIYFLLHYWFGWRFLKTTPHNKLALLKIWCYYE